MKKALIPLLVAACFVSGLMYYIDRNFLYTPFSKLDEDITVYSWYKFRQPLELEISLVDSGWKSKKISEANQIVEILEELKKLEYADLAEKREGRNFVLTLRKEGTSGLEGILLQFHGYEHGNIGVNNGKIKRLSDGFRRKITAILNDIESGD
jgi:hypothetical protein